MISDTKKNLNVQGIPTVSYGGQGGLGDVVLHPDFKNNHWIYQKYWQSIGENKREFFGSDKNGSQVRLLRHVDWMYGSNETAICGNYRNVKTANNGTGGTLLIRA